MSDFEKVLLGACLRSEENISIILDELRVEDFSSSLNRSIFDGIKSLHNKKTPIDPFTVSNHLKGQGKEVLVSQIIEIENFYFDGFNLDFYISQVKTHSKRRRLLESFSKFSEELEDPLIEYPQIEAKIVQEIMGLLDNGKGARLKSAQHLLDDLINFYYTRKVEREQGRRHFGIPTGFRSIDSILGGLQNGTLGILAGRLHHGKTTVATNIFLAAVKNNFPSLYISLEQPSLEVLLHLIQKETAIKPLNIKRGNLSIKEEKFLTSETYSQFRTLPMLFEDRSRSLSEITMKIRRMVLSHKVALVVIDYLQLIENSLRGEPRHVEVAGISRTLKRLAMDLNVSILALSQLNKGPEERESKKIYLSDMRESEAISQDADYVIFIHRPILMGKDDKDHLELAKNRYGETISRINVIYDRMTNTYRETEGDERAR